MSKTNWEEIVEECNRECRKCHEEFAREGMQFSHGMCKCCPNGFKLHEALCHVSPAEQKWDKLDWNSSKFKDYYNG